MNRITKLSTIILSAVLLFTGCRTSDMDEKISNLKVTEGRITDNYGREVVLNGINHIVKNTEQKYLHKEDESLFKDFAKYGFNCIRYGIIWDGIEPEPGLINEEYLKEIDKRVKWAEENKLWLVLDMHQDLYSQKFSDGAPAWATLDENKPHITGDVWSDSYLISPAVHSAFDNFWKNNTVSDGKGVQDHYLNVLKILAERYKNSPSVAGFDIMNEPFMGSEATFVFEDLIKGYANALSIRGKSVPNADELIKSFGNEESRIILLKHLNDKDLFKEIMSFAGTRVKKFEEGALSDFYQKARDVIRSTGNNKLLFLEHNYFCNMGMPSYFKIPKDENNNKDTNCIYAPHGYDLVTDTDASDSTDYSRTEVIFEQIFQNGKNKETPIWIGEWGAFYMGKNYIEPASHIMNMITKAKCGQAYWCWWPEIETQDYFYSVLVHTYPMAVTGKLINYSNTTEGFTCEWEEETDKGNYSKFFISDISKISDKNIAISPESEYRIEKIDSLCPSGYLIIKNLKEGGKRAVRISSN